MLWTDVDRVGRFLDPWSEFERINRLLSGTAASPAEFPGVNIWANGNEAVVTTEIPGIDPAAVDISVVGRSVSIRGSRCEADEKEEVSYHRHERWSGQFSRTIELPFLVDANKVSARFIKGVLQITLPKAEAEKTKKITIKAD